MVNVKKLLVLSMIVFWLFCIAGCESKETDSRGELGETDPLTELKESSSRDQKRESMESYSRGELKEAYSGEEQANYRRLADLADLKERLDRQPPPGPFRPIIDQTADGIRPVSGECGTTVTLRGEGFGEKYAPGHSVRLKKKGGVGTDMPIRSWADTLIEFDIPCETLQPGNYRVRVVTPGGESNIRVFSLITEKTGG